MTTPDRIDERISKCQKILAEDPNSQIFAALADSFRKKGDLEQAFRICQSGLKIHPSYGSAHVVMSKINLDRGLYDWAEAEAKKAADIDGRTRTIELLMAEIHIYKGEFTDAIKLLKKLLSTDPENVQIQRLLEIAQKIPSEQAAILGVENDSPKRKAKIDVPQSMPVVEAPPAVVEEPIESERELVTAGIRLNGVDGIVLVNNEGLVIDKEWAHTIDPTLCGATLKEAANLMNDELLKSSFGEFSSAQIEAGDVNYFASKVKVGLAVFVTDHRANLGAIRMKIDNLLGRYR